jgi:hypothetical protein
MRTYYASVSASAGTHGLREDQTLGLFLSRGDSFILLISLCVNRSGSTPDFP